MATKHNAAGPGLPGVRADAHDGPGSRQAIAQAAIRGFGQRGYYGTSLQSIADQVGMTKAGVLHHAGSKEGLLDLVLNDMYDGESRRLIGECLDQPRPLIAHLWRRTVALNARRPLLVQMFSTLSAEALDPAHPAHTYFQRRERSIIDTALNVRWSLPDGVRAEPVLRTGFSAMDGLQLRWLRTPGQDLRAMWSECEDALMPLPLWSGYR
ncbi:TetR/AcrR family transcriptional regulator [Bifidobacterium xylocopae]|uniref:AcrR family transcriptional regulator n=1 Tax=Bifidobacterium xylocopae TaxID=2493119 RepID=A0A366KD65_9BIFI|nr:TetR/AcrR family transcriptional regulator [Bifidobacterium xylocopae]RBP99053.1 AcrR family transcriptional regulator [Bifidobacterium xylocopae]